MTTRRLVILRHAKADRPAETADLDRPLTCSMTKTGWQRIFTTVDVRTG